MKDKYLILNKESARDIFYYAYYNNTDISYLSKLILDTKDLKYIKLFLTHIKEADKSLFLDFILSTNNARYIYNVWLDIDEYVLKTKLFLNKLIELNNKEYLFLMAYNYFIVKNLYDEEIFNLIQTFYKEIKITNYKDILRKLFAESKNKYKIDINGYTNNCYKGHNGVVPFIIVCHISSRYEKILYNFYDEKSDVSSHFVISRTGNVSEVVSLDDSAWANGTSLNETSDVYYKLAKNKYVRETAMNANYFTFSIEHESFDGTLTDEEYKASLNVMKKIIKYLKDTYNYDFIIDEEHIIGHSDVAPIVRTKCPGNNFPFKRLINDLKNNN
jgi:N-acetyl-anhydromuramyl-L-alanine amidase AmpD